MTFPGRGGRRGGGGANCWLAGWLGGGGASVGLFGCRTFRRRKKKKSLESKCHLTARRRISFDFCMISESEREGGGRGGEQANETAAHTKSSPLRKAAVIGRFVGQSADAAPPASCFLFLYRFFIVGLERVARHYCRGASNCPPHPTPHPRCLPAPP